MYMNIQNYPDILRAMWSILLRMYINHSYNILNAMKLTYVIPIHKYLFSIKCSTSNFNILFTGPL